MKKYVLFASAILAFASCANDSYLGTEEEQLLAQGEKPITFGFDVPAATRAEGAAAAGKLNKQFIVWGEKGEADGTAPVTDGSTTHQLVFPNYKVTYTANTAYTTTSNTKDWEYVGLSWETADAANIKMGGTAVTSNAQTIKYWDYAAASYTFTAVSAKPEDITAGRVVINKKTSGSNVYEKGYEITLTKDASDNHPSLADLYFSDRNYIAQGTGKDRTAPDVYGGNVKLKFRNSLTQVRAGVYETIPGYQVTAIKFYITDNTEAKNGDTSAFGVMAKNISPNNYTGTLTVTYYDNTDADTENHPKLSFSGTPANDLILGTNMSTLSTSNILGKTSASPTWDTNGGTFTSVLPQIDNTTNMKLKVDYTLWNSVTGETINITGKTAEVPGKYLAWKPNFKYTYLFKITDDDLYPITFDAVTIEAEDGTAEYITTVTEPSITTFGVKGDKYVAGKDEYETGTDIYATIVKNHSVVDPEFMTRTHLYKVKSSDLATFPVTEAAVAEALAESPTGTAKISCTHICTPWKDSSDKATQVTSVPSEDGSTITQYAVKFSPASDDHGYYAIQYIDETSTITYEAVTLNEGDLVGGYYTEASGNYTPTTDTAAQSGVTYYRQNVTGGHPVYKVIKVVAAP